MAFSLAVFLAQVDSLLTADNDELAAHKRYWQIKSAVERYSQDRPDDFTEDFTGDGGRYYPLTGASPSLSYWVDEFSQILNLEYPAYAVTADHEPAYLTPEDWDTDYWASTVRYLRFPNHSPASTETVRVKYTRPYQWSASATTTSVSATAHGFSVNDYVYLNNATWTKATDQRLGTHIVTVVGSVDTFTAALLQADTPPADFFALCHLAAGLCCQALADKYSRTNDTLINADSVNHISRAQEFRNRANELIKLYERHMGLTKDANTAVLGAGEFVDWNTAPSATRRSWLTH